MKSLFRFLITLILLSIASKSLACRCAERTLAEHFDAAEHVALAEVIAITRLSNREIPAIQYTLKTHRQFKGLHVLDVYTADSSASCGVQAELGKILWLFAYPLASDADAAIENPWVDTCSGTRPLSVGFQHIPPNQVLQEISALANSESSNAPFNYSVRPIRPDSLDSVSQEILASSTLTSPNGLWRAGWVQHLNSSAVIHSGLIIDHEKPDYLLLHLDGQWKLIEFQWINDYWVFLKAQRQNTKPVMISLVLDIAKAELLYEHWQPIKANPSSDDIDHPQSYRQTDPL